MVLTGRDEIDLAFKRLDEIIYSAGVENDITYYDFHKLRYMKMARTVTSKASKGSRILNIGSHYLHSSLIFKFLGYQVDSMDVSEFWDLDFVKSRSIDHNVTGIIENDLEHLPAIEGKDQYDVILFAEIFEHITFNPVNFWKRIYDILQPSGFVYISTPNSMNLFNMARTMVRVITLRGVGIPVASIFNNVTYGHHWKEYSVSEMKKYFRLLSDDFHVETSLYHYRKFPVNGPGSFFAAACSWLGNALYFFSDEIEAIIKVEKRGNWKAVSPQY